MIKSKPIEVEPEIGSVFEKARKKLIDIDAMVGRNAQKRFEKAQKKEYAVNYDWGKEQATISDGLSCVKLTFNQVRDLANALAEEPEQMHKIK